MIAIYHPAHRLHAPEFEIFRGVRVACFETPARADMVERCLSERGHVLQAAHIDSQAVVPQVHSARYLHFLEYAWQDWVALDAANAALHFTRLGERLGQLGLPAIFVLEGGHAAAELGTNAINVLDGFEQTNKGAR